MGGSGRRVPEWPETLSDYIEIFSRIYLSSCYVNVDFLWGLLVVGDYVEIVCC
jgi:hypothetical protein